jgi:uncharacterized protein with HEPN domain
MKWKNCINCRKEVIQTFSGLCLECLGNKTQKEIDERLERINKIRIKKMKEKLNENI